MRVAIVLAAVLIFMAQAGSAVLAQDEYCPGDYPVDCGTGECCPAGAYCAPEGGCVPSGWSSCGGGKICPPGMNIACPRLEKCYASVEDAMADGCSFDEHIVCGVPAQ
jgi:hypothetical protein